MIPGVVVTIPSRSRRRFESHRRKLWFRVYRARVAAGLEVCRQCGAPGSDDNPLTFDHLVAYADGGAMTFENATILCRRCNNDKGTERWGRWAHLRSLAQEEVAAPADRRWYVLALIETLRVNRAAYSYAGAGGSALTLARHTRRGTICHACSLDPARRPVGLGFCTTAVLDHIEAHRAVGHLVPSWVDDLVRDPAAHSDPPTGHAAPQTPEPATPGATRSGGGVLAAVGAPTPGKDDR